MVVILAVVVVVVRYVSLMVDPLVPVEKLHGLLIPAAGHWTLWRLKIVHLA